MHRVASKSDIGKRIKQCREAQGMKRQTLATRADIATNTIRNYEEGITFPSVVPLYQIARVLDVEMAWLIDGDLEEVVT